VLGVLRKPRAHRQHVRSESKQLASGIPYEREHLLKFGDLGEDVHLVEHDHDLLAPVADRCEKEPLRFGERTVGRGDEENEVRSGDKVRREPLMLSQDRVRPWRVDNVYLLQQLHRCRHHAETVGADSACHAVAVLQHLNLVGRRCHTFLQQGLSDESVDESAFSRVELADDDEDEQLVKLAHRRGQGGLVTARRAELGQRVAEAREQLACVCEMSFGLSIQHAQHA
jgi:hypothetical protein